MNLLDALLLGLLQGVTEFLPISSSGHLVIAESFMQLPVQDLMGFDIAVHFGTLLAILVYFRKDFIRLIYAFFTIILRKPLPELRSERKMIEYLIIGTVPAVIVGLFFKDFLEEHFRDPMMVAIMLFVVAAFFVIAEFVKIRRPKNSIGYLEATIIGIAQAVALIPGVSRSGSTIAAGLTQGVERHEAARFSFLLGAVAITAATVLALFEVAAGEIILPEINVLLVGIAASFASGFVAMSFLMRFLKKNTLHVFAGYLAFAAVYLFVTL